MSEKTLPFNLDMIKQIIKDHPTPFHIYNEAGIRDTVRLFRKAFAWVPGKEYKNYFALKACPNPHLLKIIHEEGSGVDCSSLAELVMSERTGVTGEDIMLTSNDTPAEEYRKARALGAIINLDDITYIDYLEKAASLPDLICFRYNPGPLREGNDIIGNPVEAKYGLTREQISEAYRIVKEKGVKRFGLHTMIVSNMCDIQYLLETARMLFSLAVELYQELGITFEFVNLGGGIGIPYLPEDEGIDPEEFGQGVQAAYKEIIEVSGHPPLRVVTESGRAITGPHGYLVTTVRHVIRKYRDYAGLDACMADLMRPALYGAYHHITVLGKEDAPRDKVYDVTGSLCENNDKFAVQRSLPEVEPGDIMVIHDTGAHGHAMGFQYNGKLRSAELLLQEDGSVRRIRRAETIEDYFATLDF